MANTILDPNDYVPDPMEASGIHAPMQPNTPWGGQGPLLAAAGNIGGLEAGLPKSNPAASGGLGAVGASIPTGGQNGPVSPPSGPQGGLNLATNPLVQRAMPTKAFSQDDAQDVAHTLMGRIRSPEDIASAQDARKGALQQVIDANSHPTNTLDWLSNMMIGASQAPSWANGGMMFSQGIGAANKQWQANNMEMNQKDVQNAQAKLDQLGSEEKYSNDREKNALTDEAKIIAAQAKGGGSLFSQFGLMHTADGIIQLGADGVMHMQQPANHNYTQLVARAMTNAKSMADGFTFNSPEEKQAYINKNYEDIMSKELATVGGIINNLTNQGAIPQATPGGQPMNPANLGGGLTSPAKGSQNAPVGAAPGEWAGLNAQASAAQPQRDNGRLALLQQELAKETDPNNQAALQREIDRTQSGASAIPVSAPAPSGGPTPIGITAQGGAQNATPASTQKALYPVSGTLDTPDLWVKQFAPPPDAQSTGPMNKVQTANVMKRNDAVNNINTSMMKDIWGPQADAAKEEQMHIDTIKALMANGYQPGLGADAEAKAAKVLNWAGITGGAAQNILQNGTTAAQIQGAIARLVNDRTGHIPGKTTPEDAAQISKMYPSINEMPDPFDFKLNHIQELDARQMMRQQFGAQYMQQYPGQDIKNAWNRFSDNVLGPSVQAIKKEGGEGTPAQVIPMTRTQFIQAIVNHNMGLHPDIANDPNAKSQYEEQFQQDAARMWLDQANKNGWMRSARDKRNN